MSVPLCLPGQQSGSDGHTEALPSATFRSRRRPRPSAPGTSFLHLLGASGALFPHLFQNRVAGTRPVAAAMLISISELTLSTMAPATVFFSIQSNLRAILRCFAICMQPHCKECHWSSLCISHNISLGCFCNGAVWLPPGVHHDTPHAVSTGAPALSRLPTSSGRCNDMQPSRQHRFTRINCHLPGHAFPPCRDYSRLKCRPGGPPAVRSPSTLNGLPGNAASQQEWANQSQKLLYRCICILRAVFSSGGHVSLEQPINAMTGIDRTSYRRFRHR